MSHNKLEHYKAFARHFPNGQLGEKFVHFLNSLNAQELEELIIGLGSLNTPEELTPDLYKNQHSIWHKLFHIATRGSGKGEILITWLIQGATMNGGSDSYDINLKGRKYEVKDWSIQSDSASILAGVKSKVTNFKFWNEIVDTIRRIEKLTGPIDQPKLEWDDFDSEIIDVMFKILKRRQIILSGECNKKDLKNFQRFYELVGSIQHDSTGYTNLILRGPNCEPVELSIEELPKAIREQLKIQVKNTDDFTYILTELRRLEYVRQPANFRADMQAAVDQIVNNITYIVFRKDKINITNKFKPVCITISSLKFIEEDI